MADAPGFRGRRRVPAALLGLAGLVAVAGCTGGTSTPAGTTVPTVTSEPITTASAADPRDAVRRLVDAVNATAGGEIAAQQEVLARLVDPARAAEQAACGAASITVRIDPVLDRLTPMTPFPAGSPSASGGAPAADGAVRYRLPALLEVYTGPIRTGTDLAGLEITVVDGVAGTAPLCLR